MKNWENPELKDLSVKKTQISSCEEIHDEATPLVTHHEHWHCDCCKEKFYNYDEAVAHEATCGLCS